MEEMTINGKVYVPKEELEKLGSNNNNKFRFLSEKILADECNVMGIGSAKLCDGYDCVIIGTEFLEKAIKILKTLSMEKKGLEEVYMAYKKDSPLCIGNLDEYNGVVTGIIIAHRIEDK